MLQSDTIENVVLKFQKAYLILACLGYFAALLALSGIFENYGSKDALEDICTATIFIALYYGLLRRKKWTIPFILFVAAFGLFKAILYIVAYAESITDIVVKFIGVLFFLFYCYQLRFFSKNEVREYFHSKGSVLF